MPDPSALPAQAPMLDNNRDLLPGRRPAPRDDHADQSESRVRCWSDGRTPTGSATASWTGQRQARRIWAGVTWCSSGPRPSGSWRLRRHRAAATWPPHRRVRVRGTPRPGCGPAADLVPQRPSSPAARAHRPGCPATIATPPPLPCRPQLRAAPLARIRTRLTAASNDAASAAQPSSPSGLSGPERPCPRYPGRLYHNAQQKGGLGPATSTLPSGARAPSRPSPSVPGAHDCPVPQGPGSLRPQDGPSPA
jgi:hypothetical protein